MTPVFCKLNFILIVFVSGLSGCLRFRPSPAGALPASDGALIRGLIENVGRYEGGIQRLQARTKFMLDSPDLDSRVTMWAFTAFATPDKLRVQGYGALGVDAFDLICTGRSFVLYIPSQNRTFFNHEGFAVDAVPFAVSPADIAVELFRPIDWSAVDSTDIRVVLKNTDTAVFECTRDDVKRIITVDARWHVLRRERYDSGRHTCTTVLSNYTEVEGTPFPRRIELLYPAERTYLDMQLFRIRLNPELNPELFRFPEEVGVVNEGSASEQ